MELLLGLIIPLVSFLLQSYPRFINRFFGVDVWTRLNETNHIRNNNHSIPGKITKGFIISGFFDYPPLFPLILSYIPKKKLEKLQGFVAPFFDTLHCFAIFLITYQLTARLDTALLAQLIYMLTPLVALENSYLTPRSFGYLNFTLAFWPLLLYSASPRPIYLVICFVFTTLIFLTHRFATQSFLFAVLFFSLYDRTLYYMGVFILAGITAIAVTKGYYLRVLKGHLYNIYFWVKNYEYRFAHQVRGNVPMSGHKDFIGIVYKIFEKMSPIALLGTNIWLLSACVFLINRFTALQYVPADGIYLKMSLWVAFFYVFAVVVLSFKRLIPIGEGQRYIEMATAPTSVLSAILFFSYENTPYSTITRTIFGILLMGNFLLILLAQRKAVIGDKNRSLTDDMRNMYSFINSLRKRPRIMCIPHQITTMTAYNTNADILVNADNPGLMELSDFYPVLKKPVRNIAKKYNIGFILLRESFAKRSELKLTGATVVHASGDILLLKL